jgi:hypothetical protein
MTKDLKDAFNSIRIAKHDVKKTTFKTRYENFAWKVKLFRLVIGQLMFQKFI